MAKIENWGNTTCFPFNTFQDWSLKDRLVFLIENGPTDSTVGICDNVRYMHGHYLSLSWYFEEWEDFSGDITFPIPEGNEGYYQAIDDDNLWSGEQLKHRINLMEFIIGEI